MQPKMKTGAVIGAAHLALIDDFQNNETSIFYCEALSEIATYITLVDDPDLTLEKQMHWLKTLALIKADINTISET